MNIYSTGWQNLTRQHLQTGQQHHIHNKIYLNYAVCYLYTLTSQICRNTPIQCHIPEDQNRQLYRCENIKIHLDIEHPRWCIKSQIYVYLTLQSHTTSYITHVILATSFGSENEPSSGH